MHSLVISHVIIANMFTMIVFLFFFCCCCCVYILGNQPWILIMKLKLQHFGHLMQRATSLEKTLMLGKIEGKRRRGQQKLKWLDGTTNSMDMSLVNAGRQWGTGKPACCRPWDSKESDVTQQLNHSKIDSQASQVNPAANIGDTGGAGLISGPGRSPEERNGNPFQYSCLENSIDRGAWWATVHGT